MFDSIIKRLAEKNITAIQVETKAEACQRIQEMIPEKASIWFGGSRSLEDIKILDILRAWNYQLFDRTLFPKWSPEARQMMLKGQHADFFLWSCNAITEAWQLIFWETNWNRISSIIYGPNKVILVIGKNKIVPSVEKWFERIQHVTEQIAKRLEKTAEEIRCYKLIIERQRSEWRIVVIFVNEDLWT